MSPKKDSITDLDLLGVHFWSIILWGDKAGYVMTTQQGSFTIHPVWILVAGSSCKWWLLGFCVFPSPCRISHWPDKQHGDYKGSL